MVALVFIILAKLTGNSQRGNRLPTKKLFYDCHQIGKGFLIPECRELPFADDGIQLCLSLGLYLGVLHHSKEENNYCRDYLLNT